MTITRYDIEGDAYTKPHPCGDYVEADDAFLVIQKLEILHEMIRTRYNQASVNFDQPEVARAFRELMEAAGI